MQKQIMSKMVNEVFILLTICSLLHVVVCIDELAHTDVHNNFKDVQAGMSSIVRELLTVIEHKEKLSEDFDRTNETCSKLVKRNNNLGKRVDKLSTMAHTTQRKLEEIETTFQRKLVEGEDVMRKEMETMVVHKHRSVLWKMYELEVHGGELERQLIEEKRRNVYQRPKVVDLEVKVKVMEDRLRRSENFVAMGRELEHQVVKEIGKLKMILNTLGHSGNSVGADGSGSELLNTLGHKNGHSGSSVDVDGRRSELLNTLGPKNGHSGSSVDADVSRFDRKLGGDSSMDDASLEPVDDVFNEIQNEINRSDFDATHPNIIPEANHSVKNDENSIQKFIKTNNSI